MTEIATIKADIYYNKGFHDGFMKGMEEGLKTATKMLELKPAQSIFIQFKGEDMAENFMKQFKSNPVEGGQL